MDAAGIFLLAVGLSLIHFRELARPLRPISFTIPPPEKAVFLSNTPVVISPDGSQLAFVAMAEGKQSIWIRSLSSLEARPLPGTEGGVSPFWSPDSQYLGFFGGNKLQKIALSGGPPQTVCDNVGTGFGRSGTWNRDGSIVFSQFTRTLYRVSASGGSPIPLTALDKSRQEIGHAGPEFLPDGHHFLYFARSSKPVNNAIYVGSLDSKETKFLLLSESAAKYAPPGYLLYLRGDSLTAQAFDANQLELRGEQFAVGGLLRFDPNSPVPVFSASDNGVVTYRSMLNDMQMAWVDREGKQVGLVGPPGEYRNVAVSPDEKRIVIDRYDTRASGRDLWLYDLSRGTASRLTFNPADDSDAVWSPDGQQIIFGSNRVGPGGLYRKLSNGVGEEELLVNTGNTTYPRDWSSDGRFVLFGGYVPNTGADLWVFPLFGDRKVTPYLQTEFNEAEGRFSPNVRWVAYQSDESGRNEVYVQSFPASASKWQISTKGGSNPRWRRDGKELYFVAADGDFMAVPVKTEGNFEAEAPKALFQTRFTGFVTGGFEHYGVSADGQRFLMNVSASEGATSPITVIVNWAEEVKKQ